MAELVTGGFGFIGTNLVRRLAAEGKEVIALDNSFLGKISNLDGVECKKEKLDVLNFDAMDRLIKENNINKIYHLSGYSSATMFDKNPAERVQNNLKGFMNILELSRKHGIKIAYASTSSFYARCEKPYKEDMKIVPGTPYKLSKYLMEQAAHMYSAYYGIDVNGMRFFSVYGPYERHKGKYANNISQFLWSIKHDILPVVYGDGSQTRDFTYVDDLVDAILMIMEKAKRSELYNIGTEKEYSFNEVISIINGLFGKSVKTKYISNPLKNYVQSTLADTKKIRSIGWKTKTPVEEGIKRIIEFNEPVTREEVLALYM